MLKKIIITTVTSFFVGIGLCKAEMNVSVIAPSTATVNSSVVNNSSVTIASPGGRLRNCLTDLDLVGNANATIRINDNSSASLYFIDVATTSAKPGFTDILQKQWNTNDPFCAGYNTPLYIIVSTGTFKLSYRGQIRGN